MFKHLLEKSASKRRIKKAFLLVAAVLLCFVLTAQAAYAIEGYDENDYLKLRAFFETTTSSGAKNGNILFGDGYDPDNPATWSTVYWNNDSPKRVFNVWIIGAAEGTLDLSGLAALCEMTLQSVKLDGFNLTGCTELKYLFIRDNDTTNSFDLAGITSLKEIDFTGNSVENLEIKNIGGDTLIKVENNTIKTITFVGCQGGGVTLWGNNYQLTTVVTSNCAFRYFSCLEKNVSNVDLSGLDVSTLTILSLWFLSANTDFSRFTSLEELSICYSEELASLDLRGFPSLKELTCEKNSQLTSLDVSGLTSLTKMECIYNEQLTSLNVSGLTSLKTLSCYNNQLTNLDVSGCTSLQTLWCYRNQLTSLDVSGCTSLQTLSCDDNQLTSLDVSGCTSLQTLNCYNNQLTSLDVSGCSALSELRCQNNRLSFSTLPLVSVPYTYSPQGLLQRKADVVVNGTVDLSDEYSINGVLTAFTWYDAESGEVVTPATDNEGRFIFGPAFAGKTVYCQMTNDVFGGLTLQTVNITVKEQLKPVINAGPQDQKVGAGMTATFSVEAATADGAGTLNYQWQRSTDNGNSWYDIPGATQATYTTEPVSSEDDGTIYCCLVWETEDGVTSAVTTSDEATLYVVTKEPDISTHPEGQTVRSGETATFAVEAAALDGGTISYQWQVSGDAGATWSDLEGATEISYTTPAVSFADNGKQYRCAVTNTKEGISTAAYYSDAATLSVVAVPEITVQPQSATVADGTTATFTLEASAADAGEGSTLSYQWQKSTDAGATWSEIEGATEASYTTPAVDYATDHGTQYRCVVTNTKHGVTSEPVNSGAATLSIIAKPVITTQPVNRTLLPGAKARFSIKAESPDGGTLAYQWQVSTDDGETWQDLTGETETSYNTPEVTVEDSGKQYRCAVTNTKDGVTAGPVYSDAVVLAVIVAPVIKNNPQAQTVGAGNAVTFTVEAEILAGGNLVYQWQVSTDDGATWNDIEGATEKSYTILTVGDSQNGNQYRCVVTNAKDGVTSEPVASEAAALRVILSPKINTQPADQTVGAGNPASFTVSAESQDGGNLSYQWQVSTDNGATWDEITGATGNTYNIAVVSESDDSAQYRCAVTNSKDGVTTAPVYSNAATLSVVAYPVITTEPADVTVNIGDDVVFTIVAESKDGGTLSYQWEKKVDGSWVAADGENGKNEYSIADVEYANNGAQYRCRVVNTKDGVSSAPVYSQEVMLVVVQEPAGTINPASKQVFVTEPTTFTVEAAAPDGGTISYQWQVSTDNGETWTDIPGATGSTYTIPSATAEDHGKQFRCALTNTVNGVTSKTVYSNAATLYVTSLSITIVKPAGGHDASNPVNISNGSMVIALIEGELDKVARVTIKVDNGPEQEISPVSDTIYYLLPNNLSKGEHTITIKAQDEDKNEISAAVTFYWENYRRGFGFGRFDFGDAN